MLRIFYCYLLFSFLFTSKASAYFDPGTGSYIIQLILAFLASCYFFITNPIKFIKEKIKNLKEKNKVDKKDPDRSN
tara:strand:+ start:340 stop:567 length:228 start_codon:yes stop_codon:yes gene_type:complete